jgi:hypothetical protein
MTWLWALSSRIAGKALHGQSDNALWKPVKTDTLYYTVAHSVILDEKGTESQTGRKIRHLQVEPGWRNWQTQRTQNPPVLSTWGAALPTPAQTNEQQRLTRAWCTALRFGTT